MGAWRMLSKSHSSWRGRANSKISLRLNEKSSKKDSGKACIGWKSRAFDMRLPKFATPATKPTAGISTRSGNDCEAKMMRDRLIYVAQRAYELAGSGEYSDFASVEEAIVSEGFADGIAW